MLLLGSTFPLTLIRRRAGAHPSTSKLEAWEDTQHPGRLRSRVP